MTDPADATDRTTPRVTLNLFRGCLVATLQVDLTPDTLERFQRDLLGRLAAARVTRAVFDCSGVAVLDPEEFEGLRRVAAMARLLGARVVLAGLRPGIVAALIAMGVEGRGLFTALSLDDAFDVHERADAEDNADEDGRTDGE